MGTRRRGREAALQVLYSVDVTGEPIESAVKLYWQNVAADAEGEAFANELVLGTWRERDAIDAKIRSVSEHWRIERMSWVDRNILRLGTYELIHMADVPRRVTLNEAVELAKRFGTEQSPGFINGVLDRIATDVGKS